MHTITYTQRNLLIEGIDFFPILAEKIISSGFETMLSHNMRFRQVAEARTRLPLRK